MRAVSVPDTDRAAAADRWPSGVDAGRTGESRLIALVEQRVQESLAELDALPTAPGRIVHVSVVRVETEADASLEQMASAVAAGIVGRLSRELFA